MTTPAVILDRDGTLNREQGFVTAPDQIRVLPGVVDGLTRLRAAGYLLIVVTNQSGIARGFYDQRQLARIHAHLHRELRHLPRGYLHCPHHPDPAFTGSGYRRDCACRKPGTGLLDQADRLFRIDWPRSFLLGDSARDVLMGRGRPVRTILLRCGKPWREQLAALPADCHPDHIADDLSQAVDWMLGRDFAAPARDSRTPPATRSP